MANFAILVIGDNSSERLEQWKEFEVDGVENKYIQDIDITQEAIAYASESKDEFEPLAEYIARSYGYPILPSHLIPADCPQAKWGYVRLDKFNQLLCVVRRTNPNAKFDWCGHHRGWRDFFKLKNGGYANSVTKNEAKISVKQVAGYVSAFVSDSGWTSQGDMPEKDWRNLLSNVISGLDKETKITVFECHK